MCHCHGGSDSGADPAPGVAAAAAQRDGADDPAEDHVVRFAASVLRILRTVCADGAEPPGSFSELLALAQKRSVVLDAVGAALDSTERTMQAMLLAGTPMSSSELSDLYDEIIAVRIACGACGNVPLVRP